jgi:DNA-binding CsgD family transcriptional regulator
LGDQWRLSQILGQQAQAALVAGDTLSMRAAAEEGRRVADAIGDRFGSRQCGWRLAAAYIFQGDLTGGIGELRRVVAEAEADHDEISRVTALLILPQALAFQGDTSAGRAAAEAAIDSATALGDVFVGAIHVSLVMVHLIAGDVELAAKAAENAWSHSGSLHGTAPITSAWIAAAALASGDLNGARRWADDAIAAVSGLALSAALTTSARIAIAEGDPERADRDAHDAVACSASGGGYLLIPNVLEFLAGLAGDAGSHREAVRLFGAAEGMRERTGEVRWRIYQDEYDHSVQALRDVMGGADFDAAWNEGAALSTTEAIAYAQRGRGERKRPSSGWASLTPAELDVVRLVSEGLGNKDIAQRLFVSPRTVQSHLTRVYTKLGLTSRVQLAQEAARRSAVSSN